MTTPVNPGKDIPPVPPFDPVPPVKEPDPPRLPDEVPNPNPDENPNGPKRLAVARRGPERSRRRAYLLYDGPAQTHRVSGLAD